MMFKLSVDRTKTNIIGFFSRGKVRRIPTFHYDTHVVEVDSDYAYLGITINNNNKYEKATRKQLDQGRKAHFSSRQGTITSHMQYLLNINDRIK